MEFKEIVWVLGLFTVAVTAFSSIITILIKNIHDYKIELIKSAKELAIEAMVSAAKRKEPKHVVRPFSSYLWFYYGYLKIIDKGELNVEKLKQHLDNYGKLLEMYKAHKYHQFDNLDIKDNDIKSN